MIDFIMDLQGLIPPLKGEKILQIDNISAYIDDFSS